MSPTSLLFPEALRTYYEDPRDLLLALIRRHGGTLDRLPLAPVARDYLAYVQTARGRDLRLDIEWLHLASTLILWKSRALLPSDPQLPAPLVAGLPPEFVEQLRERDRERARAAAPLLGDRLALAGAAFSHSSLEALQEALVGTREEENEPFFSLFDLVRLFEDLERQARLIAQARRQPPLAISPEETSTEEMIAWLRSHLAARPTEWLDGTALLSEQPSAGRRNTLFLALLEAARNRDVVLRQEEVFGPILTQGVHENPE